MFIVRLKPVVSSAISVSGSQHVELLLELQVSPRDELLLDYYLRPPLPHRVEVLVVGLLGEEDGVVRAEGLGVVYGLVADDDLRLARSTPPRLGTVGLALHRVEVLVDRGRPAEDNAGEDDALATETAEEYLLPHSSHPSSSLPSACTLRTPSRGPACPGQRTRR